MSSDLAELAALATDLELLLPDGYAQKVRAIRTRFAALVEAAKVAVRRHEGETSAIADLDESLKAVAGE